LLVRRPDHCPRFLFSQRAGEARFFEGVEPSLPARLEPGPGATSRFDQSLALARRPLRASRYCIGRRTNRQIRPLTALQRSLSLLAARPQQARTCSMRSWVHAAGARIRSVKTARGG
jgi:hypothetical protein